MTGTPDLPWQVEVTTARGHLPRRRVVRPPYVRQRRVLEGLLKRARGAERLPILEALLKLQEAHLAEREAQR